MRVTHSYFKAESYLRQSVIFEILLLKSNNLWVFIQGINHSSNRMHSFMYDLRIVSIVLGDWKREQTIQDVAHCNVIRCAVFKSFRINASKFCTETKAKPRHLLMGSSALYGICSMLIPYLKYSALVITKSLRTPRVIIVVFWPQRTLGTDHKPPSELVLEAQQLKNRVS